MLVVTSNFILTFSGTENNAAKKIIRYKFEKEGKNKMDYLSFLNGNQGLVGKILK